MDINNLNFSNIILFFRFQSFPLLLNIVFLSFWLPSLFIFFYKKNKVFLYLSLAFLFLFMKEMMFFLTAKDIFSNLEKNSFLDITFNQFLLEVLLFYFFSFTIFKVFQKIHLPQKIVYFKSTKLIKTILLYPLALIIAVGFAVGSIVSFSEMSLVLAAIILLTISFKQNSINLAERNYSFFNVPQIKKETLVSFKIFLVIHFLFFLLFFYYLIIFFLGQGDFSSSGNSLNYLTNHQQVGIIIEKYSHPIKSVAYFFLLFFASSILRSFSLLESNKKSFYAKTEIIQQNFFNKLNEEKALFAPPMTLLKKSLIWLKEKLNIDYLIIDFPNLSIHLIIPKEYNNSSLEQSLNNSKEHYFPYVKQTILSEKNQDKTFFYANLLGLSRPIQKKFNDFIIYNQIEKFSSFVPANSLMSVPIFSSKKEIPQGHLIAINNKKTYWEKDFDLAFFESFSKKLNILLGYFKTYQPNQQKLDEIVADRIDQKYIKEIKLLEKKYGINVIPTIHSKNKIEFQISTLLEAAYPNNFYFIKEKEKEVFIFANYFLAGKNRNENIFNNLALLSGLSEEFIKSRSSTKNLAVFMRKVNNFFSFLKIEENFISSLAINYNFKNRILSFSNAAYRPLISYNSKKDEFWSYNINEGIPMGLKKREQFEENKLAVNQGDIFFFFPQSILEKNAKGKKYDFNALYRLIRNNLKNSLPAITEAIKKNVENFFGEKYNNRIIILVFKITH